MVVLCNTEELESDKSIEYSEEVNPFYFPPSSPMFFPSLDPFDFPPSPPKYFPSYSTPLQPSSSSSVTYVSEALYVIYRPPTQKHEDIVDLLGLDSVLFVEYAIQDRGGELDVIPGGIFIRFNGFEQQRQDLVDPTSSKDLALVLEDLIQQLDGTLDVNPSGVTGLELTTDDDIVDQVLQSVGVQQYLIQYKGGAFDLIERFRSFTFNGLEVSSGQDVSTNPEPSLIFQTKVSTRMWQGHSGELWVEFHYGWNFLNTGTFKTTKGVASESVIRLRGGKDLFDYPIPGLFLNTNRAEPTTARIKEIPTMELPSTAPKENPYEGTGERVMAVKAQSNSGGLGIRKTWKKNLGRERRKKKTTGVRIAISLEDILQTKEMKIKDAAKHLKVSRSTLKRVCRDYNIHRWPPREEHKVNDESRPNESSAAVDQERPQLNYGTLSPSNQVPDTIAKNSVTVRAKYKELRIKFQLSWPWRKVELEQEVKKRLELEAGTYYINFKDEDNELTLVACDEDLEGYISSFSPLGTPLIELFLQPK